MPQAYEKLVAWQRADDLCIRIHKLTRDSLPREERFELSSQLRRAAYSVAANIVEGSSRRPTADYCRFLQIAHGSAREVAYLLSVARRLKFLRQKETEALEERYDVLQRMLQALIDGLEAAEAAGEESSAKPRVARQRPARNRN